MNDDQLILALRDRIKSAPRAKMFDADVPVTRPPATRSAITRAERALGFELPPLLRRLYAEVADGGFGPSYGILLLHPERGGAKDASVVGLYDIMREAPASDWSQELLPMLDWGCNIWSCLDRRQASGPVITTVPDHEPVETDHDLAGWLAAWLDGVNLWDDMFLRGKKTKTRNPFTNAVVEIESQGAPRGKPWRVKAKSTALARKKPTSRKPETRLEGRK